LLAISGLAFLWYFLVPALGAALSRRQWRRFRERFNRLRLRPLLRSRDYWRGAGGETWRFLGELESASEGRVLWARADNVTVPVFLDRADVCLLPRDGPGLPDPSEGAPERIGWDRARELGEGTKVFVGGLMERRDGRLGFVSSREDPLVVIFYDCPDRELAARTAWAGRGGGEYLNRLTPYSLALGAACLLFMAAYYLPRPAFRPVSAVAAIAALAPLFPLAPPGVLLTAAYRRLAWHSRLLRARCDLARSPLLYLPDRGAGGKAGRLGPEGALPDGERYGFSRHAGIPPGALEGEIPLIVPEAAARGGEGWLVFGALPPGAALPERAGDPFAVFGALPGDPGKLAARFLAKAYALEALAWLLLMAGVALNAVILWNVVAAAWPG